MTRINAERTDDAMDFMRTVLDKLRRPKNEAKGDWRDAEPDRLFGMLQGEIAELKNELFAYEIATRLTQRTDEIDAAIDAAREECLDVAAFAFMLHDVLTRTAASGERKGNDG